jgi:hypothetical protein
MSGYATANPTYLANDINQLVQSIYKTQLAEKDYRLIGQENHIKQSGRVGTASLPLS